MSGEGQGSFQLMTLPSPRIAPSGPIASAQNFGAGRFFQVGSAAPGDAVRQTLALAGDAQAALPLVSNAVVPRDDGLYAVNFNGGVATSGAAATIHLRTSGGTILASWTQAATDSEQVSFSWIGNLGPNYAEELFITATSAISSPSYSDARLQVVRLGAPA